MTPAEYRAHREQLGLTQAGLAARLGLPRTAIVKREAGDQRITEEAAFALRALSRARVRRSGGSNASDEPRPLGAVGSGRLLGAEPRPSKNK